jgi:hypothetical protein
LYHCCDGQHSGRHFVCRAQLAAPPTDGRLNHGKKHCAWPLLEYHQAHRPTELVIPLVVVWKQDSDQPETWEIKLLYLCLQQVWKNLTFLIEKYLGVMGKRQSRIQYLFTEIIKLFSELRFSRALVKKWGDIWTYELYCIMLSDTCTIKTLIKFVLLFCKAGFLKWHTTTENMNLAYKEQQSTQKAMVFCR